MFATIYFSNYIGLTGDDGFKCSCDESIFHHVLRKIKFLSVNAPPFFKKSVFLDFSSLSSFVSV